MKHLAQKLLRKRPQSWLVFEYNGYRTTGVLAMHEDDTVHIQRTAISTEAAPDKALQTVLSDLGQGEESLPERAILLTSQAAASVVNLPINPAVPCKQEQLQELVQWEFEQILQEQAASLSLETILVGRGAMTEDEIDDVRIAIGQEKATTSCLSIAPKQFGQQAVKMGYTDEEEVEICRELLEGFSSPDDAPICRIFPMESIAPGLGNEGFPWLVCGMGRQSQGQWIQRFAALGLHLERIFPLGFTCGASLPSPAPDGKNGVITLLDGMDCYASFESGQIQALRSGPAPLSPRNPEALAALIGEESLDALWLAGPARIVDGVQTVLHESTRIPTHALPSQRPIHSASDGTAFTIRCSADALGALRFQTALTPLQTPWVEGAPPPPPWWQQSTRWWGILGILLAVLVGLSEIYLGFKRHSVTLATQEIHQQTKSVQGEIAKVQQEHQTAEQLLQTREELQETIGVTEQAANLIGIGLDLRQAYVTDLFVQLAEAVTPGIAINDLEEHSDHSLTINAWALTETEAQTFIHSLAERTADWGLGIAHQEVQVEAGRLGLMGYAMSFDLVPTQSRALLTHRTE